ncbi:uncharacterized protein LOC101863510 [Aplysia californica]|uniref:Uncharacterized protein LOC101863510 n=1 Tax=Aplysia californica TaxID=6500 RepID=A0ABM0ZZG0_APLCA|nr:uncharacterized protein LOC101863510 [Aplysia californica]
MKIPILFILTAAACTTLVEMTQFRHCNNTDTTDSSVLGENIEVTVEQCPNSLPCVFTRGSYARISIQFTARKDIHGPIQARAWGVFPIPEKQPIEIPFTVGDEGTNCTGDKCFIRAGERVEYTEDIPILEFFPKVSLKLLCLLIVVVVVWVFFSRFYRRF